MRLMLLAATTALLVTNALPAAAREYPWCARTSASFYEPRCDFTSFQQCMATVSGQRGDCIRNPWMMYREPEQREPKRRRKAD